jgi:uncharacterized protein (UPF0262 family)
MPPERRDPSAETLVMTDAPTATDQTEPPRDRLIAIHLDERSIRRSNAHVDHEREVAMFDMLDNNSFALENRDDGPYVLTLGLAEDRLVLTVGNASSPTLISHMLSMTPLKRVMKDYFIVCDSYYQAIRTLPPSKIEAIDMGRRALHDEGSQLLTLRLDGKITLDTQTARRLFTLICALHWRG